MTNLELSVIANQCLRLVRDSDAKCAGIATQDEADLAAKALLFVHLRGAVNKGAEEPPEDDLAHDGMPGLARKPGPVRTGRIP